jgi:ribosomal protein L28
MAYQCDICTKKSHAGRQHTHHTGVAGGQWKKRAQTTLRSFRPNLHWVTMPVSGVAKRVRACAKCIKRARFDLKKASVAAVAV